MEARKIDRESLIQALMQFDLGVMSSNQIHMHLILSADGSCRARADTSYTISCGEFDGEEGCEVTLLHQSGHGEFDSDFESAEQAAEFALDEGLYGEGADRLIKEFNLIEM